MTSHTSNYSKPNGKESLDKAEDLNLENVASSELIENPQANQCPYKVCGKIFKFKSSLVHHVKIHKNLKNFECKFCGKKFTTKGNKKYHERRHENLKLYQCMECGVRCFRSNQLKTHQKICDGELREIHIEPSEISQKE